MKANAKFINNVVVEGYLYSTGENFNQLSERETGETSKNPGTKYIAGDIDIAVDEAGLNIVTVHYTYMTEVYGKSGKPNTTYGVLKKIIDNPEATWLNSGKKGALKVRCTGIALGVNDFIAADGTKVVMLRNENGFCSIVNELNPENERNTFQTDMLINKVTRIEEDPENNTELHVNVSGYIFGYGPRIIPVTFVVKNPQGMNYFEELEPTRAEPVFLKVWGRVNCNTIKIEKTEPSAFGEAVVRTYESKKREYVLTGAATIPYDFGDEEVLTMDDVKAMLQDREIALAEVQKRFDEKKNTISKEEFPNTISKMTNDIPNKNFHF